MLILDSNKRDKYTDFEMKQFIVNTLEALIKNNEGPRMNLGRGTRKISHIDVKCRQLFHFPEKSTIFPFYTYIKETGTRLRLDVGVMDVLVCISRVASGGLFFYLLLGSLFQNKVFLANF